MKKILNILGINTSNKDKKETESYGPLPVLLLYRAAKYSGEKVGEDTYEFSINTRNQFIITCRIERESGFRMELKVKSETLPVLTVISPKTHISAVDEPLKRLKNLYEFKGEDASFLRFLEKELYSFSKKAIEMRKEKRNGSEMEKVVKDIRFNNTSNRLASIQSKRGAKGSNLGATKNRTTLLQRYSHLLTDETMSKKEN